jgi:hypothetical protein
MDSEDVRRRPVVLQTGGDDPQKTRRPYLAWAGTGLLGLVAAAGLVAGGTAVWSAFDPGTPGRSPAPLWFPPPETIRPQSDRVTPTTSPTSSSTPDDHGGDRTRTPKPTDSESSKGSGRTTAPTTTRSTTESGDDKSTESGDDRSGSSTTEPGDDKGGDRSGRSAEDNSGHG